MIGTQTGEPRGLSVGHLAGVAREGRIAGSVAKEYDVIGMTIERIEICLADLQEHLGAVLGPESPELARDEMKEPSQPAPLANGLREHRYRLEKIERFIKSLHSRIEL